MAVLLINTLSAPTAAEIVKYFMLVSSSNWDGFAVMYDFLETCLRPSW